MDIIDNIIDEDQKLRSIMLDFISQMHVKGISFCDAKRMQIYKNFVKRSDLLDSKLETIIKGAKNEHRTT